MSDPGGPSPTAARTLRLVHHHPGRIRMRADAFFAASDAMARVLDALGAMPGVKSVQHAPRTGSVLVEYAPGLVEPDAILATTAVTAGLDTVLDEMLDGRPPVDAAGVLIDFVRGADRVARELTGGRADLPLLVPAALAGAAVYSFVKDTNGPRAPRWDSIAWWAYSMFVHWQRSKIDPHEPSPAPADPS